MQPGLWPTEKEMSFREEMPKNYGSIMTLGIVMEARIIGSMFRRYIYTDFGLKEAALRNLSLFIKNRGMRLSVLLEVSESVVRTELCAVELELNAF